MKRALVTGIISLILIFLICLALIERFTTQQTQQNISHWQTTLSALADNQSLSVSRWIFATAAPLKEVASNNSVRLYLQRLTEQSTEAREASAQIDYLRNLIIATSNREGYTDKNRQSVNANLRVIANSSLALYDENLNLIAGTAGLSKLSKTLKAAINQLDDKQQVITTDIWLNDNDVAQIGFVTSISGLPQLGKEGQTLGYLVGIKDPNKELYGLLKNFSVTLQSLESALLQQSDNGIAYASPLRQDSSTPLQKRVAPNSPNASAIAFNSPGEFIQANDYRENKVLAVSRSISNTNMRLIIKVDHEDAIGQTIKQQSDLQAMLMLGTFAMLALLIGAGWYGNLIRARQDNEALLTTTHALEEKTNLLDAINDNTVDMVLILDESLQLSFINRALADKVSIPTEDSVGKNLNSILGSHYAEFLTPLAEQCFKQQIELNEKQTLELKGELTTFTIHLIPMVYGYKSAVMIHFHDITLIEAHQAQQTRLLQQIMQSLMHAIDLHDPYSANHSQKTAQVAVAIAEAMELSDIDLSTVEIAANLCNLGKLSIPQALLTKTGKLSDEEMQIVLKEVDYAKEILSNIEFEGPVLDTITQKHEYLDGSGMNGLSAEQLAIHARILTTANDFVAMISPRAYRESLPVDTALDTLLQDAGTRYDRQVVASLFHVIENKIDLG
ncbi:HD domain-containing phosphohydrolase [Neptuniibacter sp. PT8_73]|uniref:HD domain-containing phosphohydrolase n=1 Tax=unclassified Neptuniibacter TaxID=2630693 RepID=UPI0039F70883